MRWEFPGGPWSSRAREDFGRSKGVFFFAQWRAPHHQLHVTGGVRSGRAFRSLQSVSSGKQANERQLDEAKIRAYVRYQEERKRRAEQRGWDF